MMFVVQERELLAACLKQNPCLRMDLVTKAYNTAACGRKLAPRDCNSLNNMLQRSKHTSLQLSRCSRALGLNSAASMQHLHAFLQDRAVADDNNVLRSLAGHGKTMRRLCKTAEISIFAGLHALPHAIGSKQWADNLREQCKVEAEVHFWRGAFCKKSNLLSASMEQVNKQATQPRLALHVADVKGVVS